MFNFLEEVSLSDWFFILSSVGIVVSFIYGFYYKVMDTRSTVKQLEESLKELQDLVNDLINKDEVVKDLTQPILKLIELVGLLISNVEDNLKTMIKKNREKEHSIDRSINQLGQDLAMVVKDLKDLEKFTDMDIKPGLKKLEESLNQINVRMASFKSS